MGQVPLFLLDAWPSLSQLPRGAMPRAPGRRQARRPRRPETPQPLMPRGFLDCPEAPRPSPAPPVCQALRSQHRRRPLRAQARLGWPRAGRATAPQAGQRKRAGTGTAPWGVVTFER